MSGTATSPSVNRLAMAKVTELIDRSNELGVIISTAPCGATVIDAGLATSGSREAGRLYAEATMGGLGDVSFGEIELDGHRLTTVDVHTDWPVEACWVAQKHAEPRPGDPIDVILAGPAKALLVPPDPCVVEAAYRDRHHQAVAPLQLERPPTDAELVHLAAACGLAAPNDLYVLFAPTASLVCAIQVAARTVDNAMHRLHSAGVELRAVEKLAGRAPLPPESADTMTAMGRINDSLMYGSSVRASLNHDGELSTILSEVTTQPDSARGKSFRQILAAAGDDFHKVSLEVFCIAELTVDNVPDATVVTAGGIQEDLLLSSFFGELTNERPPHASDSMSAGTDT